MNTNQAQEEFLKKGFNDFILQKNESVLGQIKNLYLFTINHKTAPLPIREKFAIPDYSLADAIQNLKSYKELQSFLVLSTCNRTEIYFVTSNLENSLNCIYKFFKNYLNLEQKITKEYNAILNGNEVLEHAFRLACGLDSLVVGERQILSQVRSAYSVGQQEKILNNTLELLFQKAIKCGKEVHKKTNLSKSSPSISSAAVDLANRIAGPLKTKSVMVLGAGNMAKLVLEHILKVGGAKETLVLNKSPHRVIEFPQKYKISKSFPFEKVYEVMNDVDILIAATGAPHFIVFADQFVQVRKDNLKSLYIFDISMPRNIDSEFGKLQDVKLFDIDSLQTIYSKTTQTNEDDLIHAREIISSGISDLTAKVAQENINLLIKDLKLKVEKIRVEKLAQETNGKISFKKSEIDYITKVIINSILHLPFSSLKKANFTTSKERTIKMIRDLFQLHNDPY